jgi:hypothetical protein
VVAGATVDALIPFYAIGVFTGFAMAGFGMARYRRRVTEAGWRHLLLVNAVGGIYTALVVCAVRGGQIHRGRVRRVVLLLVDSYDLASVAAIRYVKSLRPSALRAVHFERPVPPSGADPIGSLRSSGKATVQGRLRAAEVLPAKNSTMLACEVATRPVT